MKNKKIITKIGIFLLFLFLALILTYFSRFIIHTGERTSTGDYVPGFPVQIYDLNSKGCLELVDGHGWLAKPGCQNWDFLPLFLFLI
jgi:hypothetical protein